MFRYLELATGIVLGTLLVRERHNRQRAERFAAAGLESLLRAIDANDRQTGAHVRRVAAYSLILADALGLDSGERRIVELTALFHDIGKIHEALFDIIHEPRRLTRGERRAIATHPARGADVLAPIAEFHPRLAQAVLAHHERWDGRGYPRQISGTRIPLPSRVVAIADTFDVVTWGRRYHGSRDTGEAVRTLLDGRGTQFDPALVDFFLLPPVFASVTAALRRYHRRGERIPRRKPNGKREKAPQVRFRWRTRTDAPAPVRGELKKVARR